MVRFRRTEQTQGDDHLLIRRRVARNKLQAFDLTLEIPYDLDIKPAGKLEVFHPSTNSQGPAFVFDVGSAQTDDQRRVRIYRLRTDGAKLLLTYHPGDQLWATLAVDRMGSPDWLLTWTRGRSALFGFDHLAQAPVLQQKDQDPAKGETAIGVALHAPPPGTGLPSVPELMPVIRLEKR